MQSLLKLLLYLSAFSPLLGFASITIFQRVKVRAGYFWLMAFASLASSWVILVVLRFFLPLDISLPSWKPEALFPLPISFVLDGFSWPLAFSLASLGFGYLLTETTVEDELDVQSWGYGVLIIGLGITAILAANQLSLLLAWAGLDLVELFIWLSRPHHPTLRERVVFAFASRSTGILLSLWGAGDVNIYFLAIFLRLGVLPFHLPYLERTQLRRGLGTLLRIVPAVSTFPFLVNLATYPDLPASAIVLPLLTFLALFAAILWFSSNDVLEGRPYWVLILSLMVIVSVLKSSPEAVLAWGVLMVTVGGGLFLNRYRNGYWIGLYVIQILILSGIPFSPLWDIVRIYRPPLSIWSGLLIVVHILLLGKIIRYTLQKPSQALQSEQWIKFIYGLGLTVLMLIPVFMGYLGWGNLISQGTEYPYPTTRSSIEYVIGGVILVVVIIASGFVRLIGFRKININPGWVRIFSLEWLFPFLKWSFRQIESVVSFVYSILEGQGGILWTLLLVILLGSFILAITS